MILETGRKSEPLNTFGCRLNTKNIPPIIKLLKFDPMLHAEDLKLNSSLFWWFLKTTGDTLQGDARRVKTNYVKPFPLPETVKPADEKHLAKLTTAIIAAKAKGEDPTKIAGLELDINVAVYALYGLDAADIEIIERSLKPDLVLV